MIREAIQIKLHPNNMNREDGLCLSQSRKPIIHSLKGRRNTLPQEYVVPAVLLKTRTGTC
jgi:hypothetical protein